MVLCIGEILADLIGEFNNNELSYSVHIGGAPFNVAVNIKQQGGNVGFIGRLGKDSIGKYLYQCAERANIDQLDIKFDDSLNTTLAFVTINNGERSFEFFRNNTADYNIDINDIDFKKYKDLNIVHLGSLMLSKKGGLSTATAILKEVKKQGLKLSFDVNYREDIYEDNKTAIKTIMPFIINSDIVKFSKEELELFTNECDVKTALASLSKPNKLLLCTLGSEGCVYYLNGEFGIVSTQKVTPIDTTGAGDSFLGSVLASLDGIDISKLTKNALEDILQKANLVGAKTTLFKGAIKI